MYTVYILLCRGNTLYTGIAKDLNARIATHKSGKGSKYVRSHLPVKLIYSEELPDKNQALKREIEIKSWDRKTKIEKLKLQFAS